MKEMTTAEAREAGLLDGPVKTSKTRSTRKTAPRDGTKTRCCTPDCGEVFTGETAERRHSDTLGHNRFEMVLE